MTGGGGGGGGGAGGGGRITRNPQRAGPPDGNAIKFSRFSYAERNRRAPSQSHLAPLPADRVRSVIAGHKISRAYHYAVP